MSDFTETEPETVEQLNIDGNHSNKFQISTEIKEYLKTNYPEVLNYINFLEKLLNKHKKKLKKYKSKFKKNKTTIACQTDDLVDCTIVENESKSITDEIKEAAELATQNSGFIYDESSGLYYDSNTGYYYNAEYGLYYDANTGTYMSYNQDTKNYEFHSQVAINPKNRRNSKETRIMKRKHRNGDKRQAGKIQRIKANDSAEEGECTQTSSSTSDNDDDDDDHIKSDNSDLVKQWPPCMRIIVEQSKLPTIKIGSLHILTYEGGTLGREGDHDIILPDINISKFHLKFTYDETKKSFFVIDLGSRNGTILNGKRMSPAKQESEPYQVVHGSRIQISSIVLLCHIHDGDRTCGLCEPGLLQIVDQQSKTIQITNKCNQHKLELKNLRRKFGVSVYNDGGNVKLASGYTDRAQQRRDTVGSQNPHEKTEIASIDESISSQNKGFKLLSKMGWKEGDTLGKDSSQGLLEPIKITSNPGTSGIGSTNNEIIGNNNNKRSMWKKTQDRFNKATMINCTFDESD